MADPVTLGASISAGISVATEAVGLISGIVDLFSSSPDYEAYLSNIVELLGQIVAQQDKMIGLLTYLVAIMLASISNSAVVSNLEHLQSSVDYFNLLSTQGILDESSASGYVYDFRKELLDVDGLTMDLSVIHHNIVGTNLDLSPSLVASFRKLASMNPNVNTSSENIDANTMYYFTRLVQYQYAGYGMMMWASQKPASPLNQAIFQSYATLMQSRIEEQVVKYNSYVGTYFQGTGLVWPVTANNVNSLSYRQWSAFEVLFVSYMTSTAIVTSAVQAQDVGTLGLNVLPAIGNIDLTGFTFTNDNIQSMKIAVCRNPTDPQQDKVVLTYINGNSMFTYTLNWGTKQWSNAHVQNLLNFPNVAQRTMQMTCFNNAMYLSGFTDNGVVVTKLDQGITSWAKISTIPWVSPGGGYNVDFVLDTLRLFVVNNQLVVSFLFNQGVAVLVINTQNGQYTYARSVTVPGVWTSDKKYFTTVEPIVSNDVLYFTGRADTGMRTFRYGKVLEVAQPYDNVELAPGPAWSDAAGYNAPAVYNSLRAYYSNNVGYISVLVPWTSSATTTTLQTCALLPTGWSCEVAANEPKEAPQVPVGTPYSNVANYNFKSGSLPVFWTPGGNWFGNPTAMLTNTYPIPVSSYKSD